MKRSFRIFSIACLALVIAGCASLAARRDASRNSKARAVAAIVRYEEDGMLYTPDQVCPAVTLRIELPVKYAGRVITVGLLPINSAKDLPICRRIESLVGMRVSLDVPEPLERSNYLLSPEGLRLKEEPKPPQTTLTIRPFSPMITPLQPSSAALGARG